MRPLQMVDTRTQYQKIKEEVDLAVLDVMQSGAFINGPVVQSFADDLAGYQHVKHVIPCANGTDALQMALMALGLQPGDEVITPSFTFIATTEVIALLGLKPVFADVDPETYCIDIADIEKKITPKTRVILPVHLYGQAANMEAIMALAGRHGLYVVEDNAQAIGAEIQYQDGSRHKTGTLGDIGCTSFYPSKNLGAFGDGGALFTNNDDLAAKLKMIANHGQQQRYYHELVGCNSRLDSMQAAILQIKLRHLDAYNDARRQVAAYYDRVLGSVPQFIIPKVAAYSTHVYHQYTLVVEGADRNELQQYLAARKIPSMIYYPVPSHQQQMFAHLNLPEVDLPVTSWLNERVISLPIHTEMDEEQLQFITDNILAFIHQK
ncbi:DegT/DnrJ/EryC1/StrS family aminotransferase [Niabella terrae]